jgi:hypothetical protein
MGQQRMSIPEVADFVGHEARRRCDVTLEALGGVLEAPAVAKKRASALTGDLSRT